MLSLANRLDTFKVDITLVMVLSLPQPRPPARWLIDSQSTDSPVTLLVYVNGHQQLNCLKHDSPTGCYVQV